MALSPAQLERYARHVLLAEIGETGQERLLGAAFELGDLAPGAAVIAREYLTRAGMMEAAAEPALVAATEPAAVSAPAATAATDAVTATLLGAWHAVEQIKHTLDLGTAAAFPEALLPAIGGEERT